MSLRLYRMLSPRENKTTPRGQRFLVCNGFPVCSGTRDTDGQSAAERHEARNKDANPWVQ